MAYDISSDNFLATKKIELDEEFGKEAYVELREPSKKEFLELAKTREGTPTEVTAKFTEKFAELLPKLIVNHGFTASGKPASNEQVRDAVYKKIKAANKVEADYLTWATAPFQSPSEGK